MLPFSVISSAIQDLNRLGEILTILTRHGFGFLVERLQLGGHLPRGHKPRPIKLKATTPQHIRMVLEELGPTFIKLGQVLSMRPDMIPKDYLKEFSKLQDRVQPFSKTGAESVLREELGAPVAHFFKSFQAAPFAAASIAQVHRAITRDHQPVVIKLQRPGLKRRVEADLEILKFLAKAWESLSGEELPRHPVEFVNEFETLLRDEMDFLVEARHLERFSANFKTRPEYRFPKVYWNLSTSRCLTLEYIEGTKLSLFIKKGSTAEKQRLAQLLFKAYILMTLQDQFFHADPHTGNFLVDKKKHLVIIDTGQVGRLDKETVEVFTEMLLALVRQDTEALVDAYLQLGAADDIVDRRRLKRDVSIFLEQYYSLPIERISFGKALQDLVGLAIKHRIEWPQDFAVLAKTFLGVEGLAQQLHPQLNLVATAAPEAESILRRRYTPREMAKALTQQWRELERFLFTLPKQLKDLLAKLQQGQLKIAFAHKGLEDLQHSLERDSNRLSFALIIAALIIGSSLILFSQIGPKWGGLSLLGLVGFLLAGFFGLLLIVAIIRSGRM